MKQRTKNGVYYFIDDKGIIREGHDPMRTEDISSAILLQQIADARYELGNYYTDMAKAVQALEWTKKMHVYVHQN